jgi:hypothetical protein
MTRRLLGDESAQCKDVNQICVAFAASKLAPLSGAADPAQEKVNSAFAVLATRLPLEIDLCHSKRVSELVASKMRRLFAVSPDRHQISTGYPSEPILVEGAALLLNGFRSNRRKTGIKFPVTYYLDCLCDASFVDKGSNGELTARILYIFRFMEIVTLTFCRYSKILQFGSASADIKATILSTHFMTK